jgi:outer membrane protein insertion porin family
MQRETVKKPIRIALVFIVLLIQAADAQSGSRGGLGGNGMGPGRNSGPAPEELRKKRSDTVPLFGPVEQIPIVSVDIVGSKNVAAERVHNMLMTRKGRIYDQNTVHRDVRTLVASGLFQDVKIYNRDVAGGKAITFKVIERPTMNYVRYIGNLKLNDKIINKELGLRVGDPLNRFTVEEARRRLEQLYREKGYAEAHIEIMEGTKPGDSGVVYQIHEGKVQKIFRVEFVGNSEHIATDARLKTQIESKPGILWLFGGKANHDEIEQDKDRLTAYYRSLGFFRARVAPMIEPNEDNTWLNLKFIIDEGPRYRIRKIKMEGNQTFQTCDLASKLQSSPNDYFNLAQLQSDLATLRDHYGSQGYIFADINGEPRFQEAPGTLDLVFKFEEGKRYRVGRIVVNIDGEHAHTRRQVVLNHLSLRPGDFVDVRKLRSSERRLMQSQLFNVNPAMGTTPKIVIKPPEDDGSQLANRQSGTFRGQNEEPTRYRPLAPVVDLILKLKSVDAPASQESSQ